VPELPAAMRGRPAVVIAVCHSGAPEAASADLTPLRAFGPPAADLVYQRPYSDLQRLTDPGSPEGKRNDWKAEYLARLDAPTIEALADFGARLPAQFSKILLTKLGGAAARVAEDATAFSHRSAQFVAHIVAMWDDPALDEAAIAWARDCWATLRAVSGWGGVYVNYLGEEGPERVRQPTGTKSSRVSLRSSAATTRTTSSASTRTSDRRNCATTIVTSHRTR